MSETKMNEATNKQEVNYNIEKWVTLKEIQAYLGVGRDTILQWIE